MPVLLPGPPGSTSGDYWVGDRVTLHTGESEFEYNESAWLVDAITVQREDANAELVVIPELVSPEAGMYQGDVFAGYQHAGGWMPDGNLAYGYTYDNPNVGWCHVPKIGPIEYDQTEDPFYSFTVTERMICRLNAAASWIGVVGEATKTIYVAVNDVVVGSDTESTGGGLHYWNVYLEVDVRNYELQAGDVVKVYGNDADSGWGNNGVNETWFLVGRGHIVGVGFDWTGP